MGTAPERCPRCGGGNIIGYKGEWECMDCGYKFSLSPRKGPEQKPTPPQEPVPSKTGDGIGKWIALILVAFILGGLILGYGIGYGPRVVKEVTVTQLSTKPVTVTMMSPPSTVITTLTVIKTHTQVTTATVTQTVTATPKPPSGCEIVSASVVMRNKVAHLYVKFTTSVTAALKLIGPDGEEKSSDIVSPDETAVYLPMSTYGETPLLGKYKVVMESLFGKLAEKEFEFSGYEVKAVKLEFEKKWYEYLGGSLLGVIVHLENSGDLPTYVVKARLTLDEETKMIDVFPEPIPPGSSSIKVNAYASGLKAGSHTVKVVLINDEGNEIATIEGSLIFP